MTPSKHQLISSFSLNEPSTGLAEWHKRDDEQRPAEGVLACVREDLNTGSNMALDLMRKFSF